jgi:hypothetical protein
MDALLNLAHKFQTHIRNGSAASQISLIELRQRDEISSAHGWVWQVSDWMDSHYEIPFFVMLAYVLFVYFGRKFMEKREAYELQYPLAVWNAFLASISLFLLFLSLLTHSLQYLWCLHGCARVFQRVVRGPRLHVGDLPRRH